MSTTIEQIRDEVAQAQARLAAAESKLRELEAKSAKWEPKGGEYFLGIYGGVRQGGTEEQSRIAGGEYPTREAAESALPYVTFYKRLCCLAQELNPSGKVGGKFGVTRDGRWMGIQIFGCIDSVFETEGAAERAAEIMTRDNWQLPTA